LFTSPWKKFTSPSYNIIGCLEQVQTGNCPGLAQQVKGMAGLLVPTPSFVRHGTIPVGVTSPGANS